MPRVRVIGFGNPAAGDDAVGLIAAEWVRQELEGVQSVEVSEVGPGTRLPDLLDAAEAVVAVEAVRPSSGPRRAGRLVRAEYLPGDLPREMGSALSSAGCGVAETIGLAAALGGVAHVVFVGVEVADVSMGRPLSEPVAAALRALVGRILVEVDKLLALQEAER